jgi:hypothetical protein
MSLIVKVVLARIPGTWEIERQAPMQVFTRTALLGLPEMRVRDERACAAQRRRPSIGA